MVSHPIPVHLSRQQQTKLLKGQKVLLRPHKSPNSRIFVDGRQARAFLSRHQKGSGYRVQLSPAHAHMTLQHGEGFGDFLKKAASIAQTVSSYIPDSVKDSIKDKALDLAQSQGKKYAGLALGKAGLGSVGSALGLGRGIHSTRYGKGICAPGGGGIGLPGMYM